jgi:spermidine/putrescine transport system ATP-binding protein
MAQLSVAVEIGSVTRRFREVLALDRVSLSVRRGEFFSLLGPSGCGKTTLLRVIAGLDLPDEGTVRIDQQDATPTPAHLRPVNTVFQSYALFPHMDVWHNIAFGLRMKGLPAEEIRQRVHAVSALVQLQGLDRRRPSQLSGGQKQRVALARAVVNEPKVLLLDEPLAALDVKLRKQLQEELRSLQRRLGITFIYVTHDQEEALVLSDRLAVMREGRIVQIGTPEELYEQPQTRFTSQFVGSCNLLQATLSQREGEGAIISTELGALRIATAPDDRTSFTLAIRPEKIHLFPSDSASGENYVPVLVENLTYAGSETHYCLRAGHTALRAEIMNTAQTRLPYKIGQHALAHLPPACLIVLND